MRHRLGVSGGPVPRDPDAVTPALARELAELGVSAVVTHFTPAPAAMVAGQARRVRQVLAEAGIRVVQATGYNPNMVHPDGDARRADLERLRAAFDAARLLGAEMIISGCGSHHPSFFYGPARDNHTQQARDRLVASLRQAAPWAESAGVVLALECHVQTTLDTPTHIREVLDAVDSPWVRANFDPVNLLGDLPTVFASGQAMRHMWATIGPRYAPSAHFKDVGVRPELVVHIDEMAPGEGILDLDTFFAVCRELGDGAAIVVEHLPADQARAALAFTRRRAAEAGITWQA